MTLSPLGDSALVLSFGEGVDDAALNRVRAVAEALRHAKVAGILDVVPAFATVAVFYDIAKSGPYAAFEQHVSEVASKASETILRAGAVRTIEIPVCYGGEWGPDFDDVVGRTGATAEQVIEWHTGADYRVHAIGFVPGFAYLAGLPRRLHAPRKPTPRTRVPAGSVGIGGAMTGVYPISTPGGWNIIGRTPLVMFDLQREEPALLHACDRVKFRAITAEEFATWK